MTFLRDSHCGLYCGACPVLHATEGGHVDRLAEGEGMDPGDLVCRGCRSDVNAVYCRGCRIRACAETRGVQVCGDCIDYPCQMLEGFRSDEAPHHSAVLANQERIRRVGLERWLEEQEQRWRCSCCWTDLTWYDQRCPECGSLFYDCRSEESDIEE